MSWRCLTPHALLDCDVIAVQPEQYLRSVGTVFAEFGALTQDSGNVSYGVRIAAERYFVKTAGRPDDPRPFLKHAARVALLRNAVRLSGSLGIVDLDTYREGPFRNEMGRMFGSARFMAPEEFELGALIDQRTNVFVMGRTALVFLSDGTLSADAFRGTRALFKVVARACDPERSRRYDSMAAFYRAWRAARTA